METGKLKQALSEVFDFIREANKYFDVQAPWKQVKENPEEADKTLATCVYIIVNTTQLLYPFLPYSTKKGSRNAVDQRAGLGRNKSSFAAGEQGCTAF